MVWEYLLGAMGIMATAATVCWIAWLRTMAVQKRQDAAAAFEQMAHAERMAMIEKGMSPTPDKPVEGRRGPRGAYMTLARIGTVSPVFAWLSGGHVAWIAVAIIGSICAIGTIIVYVGSIPDSDGTDDDNADSKSGDATDIETDGETDG